MACKRIRHARAKLHPLGRAHREGELDEHFRLQVLTVGEEHAVPALGLSLSSKARRGAGEREGVLEEFDYLGPSATKSAGRPRARNHSAIARCGGFSIP